MGESLHLHNLMEDIVHSVLVRIAEEPHKLAPDTSYCFCPKCRLDVTAIALNSLPPLYVVTQRGETWARAQQLHMQFEVDVLTAVVAALDVVSKNPQHAVGGIS